MNTIRKTAVQGRFYGSSREDITELIELIAGSLEKRLDVPEKARVIGAVLPHAGHVYSGYQTVPFFEFIRKQDLLPETWVIVHPNHHGLGPSVALDEHDAWENALGRLSVDKEMQKELPYAADASAHSNEHSCEVLLPYIQHYFPDEEYQILPVCMREQTFAAAGVLGNEIHAAARRTGRKVCLLASSDFSHFLTPEEGFRKDQLVLDQILEKAPGKVEETVKNHGISVCGYGPIMTLMIYAGLIDPGYTAKVIGRGHSGDVSPSREVVDYISVLFYH